MFFKPPRGVYSFKPGIHRTSLSAFRITAERYSFCKSGYKFYQHQSEALRSGAKISPF